MLDAYPVPVIPVALHGLWGPFFSRADQGKAMVRPFRRGVFSRVGLVVGEPMKPADVTPITLQAKVEALLLAPTQVWVE